MLNPGGVSAPADSVTLRISAPAKVNLYFEALGKRADRYTEIATLMVAIDLCDELALSPLSSGLVLTCDDPALSTGPENLVAKAATSIRNETGCKLGARLHLTKRIPWAAGLGGGSSDAAACLKGLNVLWDLKLSRDDLAGIAGQIGSDVPFFIDGGAAWCTGRGEIIEPMPIGSKLDLILVKPDVGLSTKDVYGRLRIPDSPKDCGSAKAALSAAMSSGDVESLGRLLFNRLEEPAFELSPDVRNWRTTLDRCGSAGALMSGSGTCLFALCRHSSEASRIEDDLTRGIASGEPSNARVFRVRSYFGIPMPE
jgi:4-diphosphocytidyl-2-C-methyl-D-erythritol kinase